MNGYKFYPEFSGRSALYKLSCILKQQNNKPVALAPDYICNVVYVALEAAGYQVQTYETNHLFEPRIEDLDRRLTDDNVGILLTASVFGSSAFLDGLGSEQYRDLILKRNIHVLVDLCQDINLITYLPEDYGSHLSAILSFNDKSFPGVMGGGILTRMEMVGTTRKLDLQRTIFLYRMLMEKVRRIIVHKTKYLKAKLGNKTILSKYNSGTANYDYSYCGSFPYGIEVFVIAKIQMIMVLIGLSNLKRINSRKLEFLADLPNLLKTVHYETSPYLVLSDIPEGIVNRRIKPSYACHNSPSESNRKLIIIHNKGFDDES